VSFAQVDFGGSRVFGRFWIISAGSTTHAIRGAHPLPEALLLVVCGTIADCDDYGAIAAASRTEIGCS
jgi:hypothetical protein